MKIIIERNDRYDDPKPVIGQWYEVTDVNRRKNREGQDKNVYFINVDGVRVGIHGAHCKTDSYDSETNVSSYFKKIRNISEEDISEYNKEIEEGILND